MTRTYLNEVGDFECVVEKPESGWFGEAGDKNTPFIRVPCVVKDGPHKGKLTIWQGWLSDGRAFDMTIDQLTKSFGFNGDLEALNAGKMTFVGMPCNVRTESDTYQGKTRIKAKWLNPPGGGGGSKPLEASKVKSILTKLGARGKAIAKATADEVRKNGGQLPLLGTTGTKTAPAANPEPTAATPEPGQINAATPVDDDSDVPF